MLISSNNNRTKKLGGKFNLNKTKNCTELTGGSNNDLKQFVGEMENQVATEKAGDLGANEDMLHVGGAPLVMTKRERAEAKAAASWDAAAVRTAGATTRGLGGVAGLGMLGTGAVNTISAAMPTTTGFGVAATATAEAAAVAFAFMGGGPAFLTIGALILGGVFIYKYNYDANFNIQLKNITNVLIRNVNPFNQLYYILGINLKNKKIQRAYKLYETYLQISIYKKENIKCKDVHLFFKEKQIYKRLAKKFVLTQTSFRKYNENNIFNKDIEIISDIFYNYDNNLEIQKKIKNIDTSPKTILNLSIKNFLGFMHVKIDIEKVLNNESMINTNILKKITPLLKDIQENVVNKIKNSFNFNNNLQEELVALAKCLFNFNNYDEKALYEYQSILKKLKLNYQIDLLSEVEEATQKMKELVKKENQSTKAADLLNKPRLAKNTKTVFINKANKNDNAGIVLAGNIDEPPIVKDILEGDHYLIYNYNMENSSDPIKIGQRLIMVNDKHVYGHEEGIKAINSAENKLKLQFSNDLESDVIIDYIDETVEVNLTKPSIDSEVGISLMGPSNRPPVIEGITAGISKNSSISVGQTLVSVDDEKVYGPEKGMRLLQDSKKKVVKLELSKDPEIIPPKQYTGETIDVPFTKMRQDSETGIILTGAIDRLPVIKDLKIGSTYLVNDPKLRNQLKKGMVITKINNEEVLGHENASNKLRNATGKITLTVSKEPLDSKPHVEQNMGVGLMNTSKKENDDDSEENDDDVTDDENIGVNKEILHGGGKVLQFNRENRASGNRKFTLKNIDSFMIYFKIITYDLNKLLEGIIDEGNDSINNFMNKYLNRLIGPIIKGGIFEDSAGEILENDDGIKEKYTKGIINPKFLTEKIAFISEYTHLAKIIIGEELNELNNTEKSKEGFLKKMLINIFKDFGDPNPKKIELLKFSPIKKPLMDILIEHVTDINILENINYSTNFENKIKERFKNAIYKNTNLGQGEKELSSEITTILNYVLAPPLVESSTIQEYKKRLRRIDNIIDEQAKNPEVKLTFTTVFNQLENENIFTNLELDHDNNSVIIELDSKAVNLKTEKLDHIDSENDNIKKLLIERGYRQEKIDELFPGDVKKEAEAKRLADEAADDVSPDALPPASPPPPSSSSAPMPPPPLPQQAAENGAKPSEEPPPPPASPPPPSSSSAPMPPPPLPQQAAENGAEPKPVPGA